MVLIFYADNCLIFSPSKNKTDDLYASIQAYFRIYYDIDLKKSLEIDLYQRPYDSIHLQNPYLTQRIINIIPGMDKSNTKLTFS